jgi:hypothetical protein
MPWGASFAPYVLQSFTAAIAEYVETRTKAKIVPYMDDFGIVAVEYDDCLEALLLLKVVLTKAGFMINEAKSSNKPT